MDNICCEKCGKENMLQGARFCAFCGAELVIRGEDSAGETRRLCLEIKNAYIDYINWSSDYIASRSAGKVFSAIFTGDSDYKTRDEHQRFVDGCEKAAGELYEHFSATGAGRDQVLGLLDYVLFGCHEHCGDNAEWMILAAEKFYLPFLDKLSREELADIHARYKAFRKKKMGLPVQDEMLKKMKKLLK